MSKYSNRVPIQITDLINELVDNDIAGRQQALESEGFEIDLIDLSDNKNQDCSQILGGLAGLLPLAALPF